MKRFPQALFFIVAMMLAVSAFGQEPQEQEAPPPDRPADRMNILRDLGLSQDQIRQIRLINQDVRAKRQAARLRVGEAMRNLDQAIYADSVNEDLVGQRLKELQSAQGEMTKVNFENEFAIRKILTPEQLVRFLEIRRNFQRQRQDRIQNRDDLRPRGDQRRGQPLTDRPPVKEIQQLRPKAN